MTRTRRKSLFDQYIKRFFFLYGNTQDEFCTSTLQVLSLERLLHAHLKYELGYKRVIFISEKDKLYFWDTESEALFRRKPDANAEKQGANKPRRASRLSQDGPLKKRVRMKKAQAQETETKPGWGRRIKKFGQIILNIKDDLQIDEVDSRMKDPTIKTAVVFIDGLDFFTHMNRNMEQGAVAARREMATRLDNWMSLGASNQNICIFIFPDSDSAQSILSVVNSTADWAFFSGQMFKNNQPSSTMMRIGMPGADEIENMLNWHRIHRGVPVHWSAWKQSILEITRSIRSRGASALVGLKELNAKLREVETLDQSVLEMLAGKKNEAPAIERLLNMKGLEVVHDWANGLVDWIEYHRRMGSTATASPESMPSINVERVLSRIPKERLDVSLHLALKGNPGTGKTTAAKLIGEIMRDAGLLELGHTVEVTDKDLVGEYVGTTSIKTQERIDEAMGGVLFIDEAHSLTNSNFGRDAITTILKAMEDRKGEFAVIIAGYPDPIDDFIRSNPGLESRFGKDSTLLIEDFEPALLQEIFEKKLKEVGLSISSELQTLLPGFFASWYEQGTENWGNARAVVQLVLEIRKKYARRVARLPMQGGEVPPVIVSDFPEQYWIFLIPPTDEALDEALNRLNDFIGLQEVKEFINKTVQRLKVERKKNQSLRVNPGHYVFFGNPGTGKTTVARRMGEILKAVGSLNRGHVVEVNRTDLVARFEGQTSQKTRDKLRKARGGILFIDEAYDLVRDDNDAYGKEALTELLTFMENNRQSVSVIVAGYPNEMKQFLSRNPGLGSRFPRKIEFKNFSKEELLQIMELMADEEGLTIIAPLKEALLKLFEIWIIDADNSYGNARDVRKLLDVMKDEAGSRLAAILGELDDNDPRLHELVVDDIPEEERKRIPETDDPLEDVLRSLDDLVGLHRAKEAVKSIVNQLRLKQFRGEGGDLVPGHYVFSGNPGTGKTTVAERMGAMFRALGLLKKGEVKRVVRADLVAGYSGQTSLKARKVLEEARDNVLFIDEAYQLVTDERDTFGEQARDVLMDFMEEHRDRLCVIVAGYPAPMDEFLNGNPGLKSRFNNNIPFDDYSEKELLEIFRLMAKQRNRTIGEGLEDALLKYFQRLRRNSSESSFGNARAVRNLVGQMCTNLDNRLARAGLHNFDPSDPAVVRLEVVDIPQTEIRQNEF